MLRILVVDDDKTMCEEFSEILAEEGHKVETSNNGVKALEVLGKSEFDVVFTDLKMPKMGGLELLREVRRLHPAIFPVMITGYATVETAVEALKMGAFDYIQKPFRMDHVREVLKHLEEERKFRQPWTSWSTDASQALERAVRAGGEAIAFTWAGQTGGLKPAGVRTIRFEIGANSAGAVDPKSIHRIKELAMMHVEATARPVLMLERVDKLAPGHDWGDLRGALEAVAEACRKKSGTILITLDPTKLTQEQVDELRKLTAEPFLDEMVDMVVAPIRRSVITVLERGPATFSEIMRGTGVDDSPKLTFHLKKLTASGALLHEGDRYGLGDKGRRAARLIEDLRTEGALKLAGPAMLFESKD